MKTQTKKYLIFTSLILVVLTMSGCATQPSVSASGPGFLIGLWHGVCAPIALIGNIFMDNVRIYEFPNTGFFYDLGFLIGISCWGGGGAAASRRRC